MGVVLVGVAVLELKSLQPDSLLAIAVSLQPATGLVSACSQRVN